MSAPKKQTAVKWLIDKLTSQPIENINDEYWFGIIGQAKAMEKEQIEKAARQCHFEGVRQSAKTSEDYIAYGQQYYKENYD